MNTPRLARFIRNILLAGVAAPPVCYPPRDLLRLFLWLSNEVSDVQRYDRGTRARFFRREV